MNISQHGTQGEKYWRTRREIMKCEGTIHREKTTFINTYVPTNVVVKHIKQNS